MEIIKKVMDRFWPTGIIILGGFILIIYIALGFVYWQQGATQKELEKQIIKLNAVVTRPLPNMDELQAEYDNCTSALIPRTDSEAITRLVSIAEQSRIDVDEDSNKLNIPPAVFSAATLSGGTYQLISFKNIIVQGNYDNVMTFLSNIINPNIIDPDDIKWTTMVLKRVSVSEVEVTPIGEEAERRTEFRNVGAAVIAMMDDNELFTIPDPMIAAKGVATNLMGDDLATEGTVEGFPNITTTAAEKGYSGNATPRGGYVLYGHDKISTDNTSLFETINYLTTLTTKYYYTCDTDGTVRQWSGSDVDTAREYLESGSTSIETKVSIDVDIYIKPDDSL